MKNGHCPCFNFPGLEENFDFSDIFACVAPRTLVCELGEQETRARRVSRGHRPAALEEIRAAYRVFNAESNVTLTRSSRPARVRRARLLAESCAPRSGRHRRGRSRMPTSAGGLVRFTDAPESLDGTPVSLAGRDDLHLTFEVPPQPGDALELRWGAKSDQRDAVLVINGEACPGATAGGIGVSAGSGCQFPRGVTGDRYDIEFRGGQGQPAFLSEVRLMSTG